MGKGGLARPDVAFDRDEWIFHAGGKLRQESSNLRAGLSTAGGIRTGLTEDQRILEG